MSVTVLLQPQTELIRLLPKPRAARCLEKLGIRNLGDLTSAIEIRKLTHDAARNTYLFF